MHPLARKDTFTLSHGGNTVHLRASLRAAIHLERLHDGFGPLFQKIEQFDTATVRQIITTATTDRKAAEAFLAVMATLPLSRLQIAALGPLVALCGAFRPAIDDTATHGAPKGKPMTWAEVFADLYQIGTGWIGWTPAETLDATPTQIREANRGFIAMQRTIRPDLFGTDEPEAAPDTYTPERLQEIDELGFDPAFDRAALHALKARM